MPPCAIMLGCAWYVAASDRVPSPWWVCQSTYHSDSLQKGATSSPCRYYLLFVLPLSLYYRRWMCALMSTLMSLHAALMISMEPNLRCELPCSQLSAKPSKPTTCVRLLLLRLVCWHFVVRPLSSDMKISWRELSRYACLFTTVADVCEIQVQAKKTMTLNYYA